MKEYKGMGFGAREFQVRKLALPPTSGDVLGQSLPLSGPRLPPLCRGKDELLGIFKEAAHTRCLVPSLTHINSQYLLIPVPCM